MKRVALIGYGYWGPNLLRNFFEHPDCEVLYCCDKDIERLQTVKKKYPSISLTTDISIILSDPFVDAVVIATPTGTHFDLIKQSIIGGKDVLVEKPFVSSLLQAKDIERLVIKHKKVLMVDHTFIFSEAIELIKKIIDRGEIGNLLYIDASMVNLGLFQKDSNVIADLGAHEFSIIQYLLDSLPKSVLAQASTHFGKQEDYANIYVEYPKNISVHIQVSWLSPVKMRKMFIVGSKKMIVYDDIEPTEKIRVYDKGIELSKNTKEAEQAKIGYRFGDIFLPHLNVVEPLSCVVKEFMQSLETGKVEKSDVSFAKEVVKLIEISTQAARLGKKITIKK